MEIITSVNDGEETEYGLIINQEELDVLVHLVGSLTKNLEKEIGYRQRITFEIYKALVKYEIEEVQTTFNRINIKVQE
jgi:hypothetical protein